MLRCGNVVLLTMRFLDVAKFKVRRDYNRKMGSREQENG
jgi:hypothetical protein